MIDNRALTVLAQVTVEEIEAATYVSDPEPALAIVEKALQEAFRRGFQDCAGGKIESEGDNGNG